MIYKTINIKRLFYFLVLCSFLSSCNQSHDQRRLGNSEGQRIQKETKTSSTFFKSWSSGTNLRISGVLSQRTNQGISNCRFNGNVTTKSDVNINLGLHFEKGRKIIKDSLTIRSFYNLIDLTNVENAQIDLFEYNVQNEQIKVQFTILLTRSNPDTIKVVDKYRILYTTSFEKHTPKMKLIQAENVKAEYEH